MIVSLKIMLLPGGNCICISWLISCISISIWCFFLFTLRLAVCAHGLTLCVRFLSMYAHFQAKNELINPTFCRKSAYAWMTHRFLCTQHWYVRAQESQGAQSEKENVILYPPKILGLCRKYIDGWKLVRHFLYSFCLFWFMILMFIWYGRSNYIGQTSVLAQVLFQLVFVNTVLVSQHFNFSKWKCFFYT